MAKKTGSVKTQKMITDIENAPAMNKLINSTEIVDKVADLTKKMNELIAAIDTKGIKMYDDQGKEVKLFTWKNTNLMFPILEILLRQNTTHY